ncbi:MAG TPA: NAD-dependent epimerase/dehydratase family protein, partial [Opitutaceae bacterium]|nr:NAD-dependent epimerase/dehydratase family protein [Opitutaceae bacterium]
QTKAEVQASRPRTPRRVLVAGGSGLVGSALRPFLTMQGHDVITLVRRPVRSADEVSWRPALGHLDARPLEGVDVINLAGANLADRRWTEERRREIEESRIQATRTLVQTIQRMRTKPGLLINASAIGYYGEGGERELREGDAVGTNFLARVCHAWEREAQGAEDAGVRVVCLRTGVILTEAGGMLARLAPIFR